MLSLILNGLIVAQELPSALTMQQAIDFALKNNRTVLNAAKEIDAANQQKWETTATGLPQISANVDYQNFIKQPIQLVPAEIFGGIPGEFAEVIFGTPQSVNGFARLDQKIFDGSYLVALQSAKVFLDISKNSKTKTDLQVRKSVIDAYGNVLLAEESVAILKRNMNVLEKNLSETIDIYENGLEEQESVQQLQITLSGVQSSLNNTIRLNKLAYELLNITMGIDVYHKISLTDNLESLAEANRTLLVLETEYNTTNTIDFKIAENDTKAKELAIKLEKSRSLPTLDAFINGGYSAFGDDFSFLDNDQRWFGSSVIGVNLNIPIFSSGERSAATQRAKINLEQSKIELEETDQRLKLEIDSAKSDYQFALEDYGNKKENLNLAEQIEEKNRTKFFEGVGSSFELRQSQTQLYTAQQEFLQAMQDVINSKASLETVLNTPNFN